MNVDVLEAVSSRAVRSEMQLMEVAPVSADGSDVQHYTGRLTHHRQTQNVLVNREETRAHVMLGVFSEEAKIKG